MLPDSTILIDAAPLLLALALKGSLLFAIALAVGSLMQKVSAASRHAMWTVTLAAALILPVLLLAVPEWHVPVIGSASVESEPASTEALMVSTSDFAAMDLDTGGKSSAGGATLPDAPKSTTIDGRAREAATSLGARVLDATPRPLRDWRLWLGMIWVMGAVAVGGRWLMAFSQARRLIDDAQPVADETSLRLMDSISSRLGLQRSVEILQSERLAVPVAWSFGSDAVVLPADWDEWDKDRRRVVLTHELAHIVRRDGMSQLIAQSALVLHWFNPLAWVTYSRFLRDREQACDDVVLRTGASASTYAEHLLAVAQRFRQDSLELLAVASMARRGELSGRIESILDPGQSRRPAGLRTALLASVLAVALAIPLAAFQPFERNGTETVTATTETTNNWDWSGTMRPGSTLEVYALNGSIEVEQGSSDRASVVASPRRSGFSAARLVVERRGDVVAACVVYAGQEGCAPGEAPRGRPSVQRNNEVNVQVVLPRDVNVKLRTTNGRVSTDRLDRNVEARSTNGAVRASSRRGEVSARTTNGNIQITTAGLPDGRTTNGSIEATLLATSWSGTAELRTTNGSITVNLPRNPNVNVEARSTNGSIRTNATDLNVERRRGRGTTASGQLGNGGRDLSLRTTNGSIRLQVTGDRVGAATHDPQAWPQVVAHADAGADLGALISESVATALSAIDGAAISVDVMSTVDWSEINATVAEAMGAIGWAAINEEVRLSVEAADIQGEVGRALEESRVDRTSIEEEVRQALEEAQRELEEARIEIEESRRQREIDRRR